MHRHTHQLIGHFHGDLVVGDIDELHCLGHLFNQICVASNVSVIQWRVNFIEHAERRRIQLEDRKNQGQCGQGFFATGEQMDGAVLLSWRLRHDRHPCIE
ncbi:hypothetical protein D3C81_1922210 [compost metagenome]